MMSWLLEDETELEVIGSESLVVRIDVSMILK